MPVERDPVSGTDTTGHEWDGITELETPVPWAARWALWLSIAFSVLYWILFPGWPLINDFTRGILGYNSREVVFESIREGAIHRSEMIGTFENDDLAGLIANTALRERYSPAIEILYRDNCAACHGRELTGQTGFPDLTDGQWLWSGNPDEIEHTILYGINDLHPESRASQMLAFGRDGILSDSEVQDVTEYVLSLSGSAEDSDAVARGASLFADNCASCHGDAGEGGLGIGAPSLSGSAWIYGGTREAIATTIDHGRIGVMPAWEARLTREEIRMLTAYVVWASEDQPHGQ